MTKAKSQKSSADAKKTESDTLPEVGDDSAAPAKKASSSKSVRTTAAKKNSTSTRTSARTTKEKPSPKSGDTDVIVKEPAKPAPAVLSPGLGIKTTSKKPALTLAPGAMSLGRPAQAKLETVPRPSERRLSKKEQADIKTFLMEKRERLLSAMRRELAMQKERAASKAADEVDKATDAYDEDLSFEIAVANDQELEDIQIALEKIERGTYGECEICGCGISPSRLKILPSATTCVSCRGQEEMARRRDDGQKLFNMLNEDGEGEGEG